MQRHIILDIEAGDKTCASEPGHFCQWMRTTKFGTVYFCHLFSEEDSSGRPSKVIPLEEKDGWLQRHEKCLLLESSECDEETDF